MRCRIAALLVGGALFAVACSNDQSPTAAPSPSFSRAPQTTILACNREYVDGLLIEVFPKGDGRDAARSRFSELVKASDKTGPTSAVRSKALNLVDFIIKKFRDGRLNGGTSTATATKVGDILTGVLCLAGLPPFDPAALGLDAAAQVVLPNSPQTTIVTGTGFAGTQINTGSVNEPTLITITRLPNTPGPLLTQFDQYPAFYEFHYIPATTFNIPVVVATCTTDGVQPPDPSRLRLAHNIAPFTMGSIEVLEPVAGATFVDCSDVAAGPAAPTDLAHMSFDLLKNALAAVVLPQRLEAMRFYAGAGLSGSVRTFSPFGGVDPLGIVTPTEDFVRTPFLGELVEVTPIVRLTTPTGRPLSGFPVNWAVTAGGGSLGNPTSTSDASGLASVGFWRFGFVNPQSLTATAVAPAGFSFANNPYVFPGVGR